MSNRLISILIILALIVFGFFYWVYFYVPNNLSEKNDSKKDNSIDLVKIEDEKIGLILGNNPIVNNEDTNLLSIDNNYIKAYKTITVGSDLFEFYLENNELIFKDNGNIIYTFQIVSEDLLDIKQIYSSFNDFFILLGNKKYLYNKITKVVLELDLNVLIEYIKKDQEDYLIKTNKGIFIYNPTKNKIEYKDILEDFIIIENAYIGIIKGEDLRRHKNFSLESNSNNIIFYYNPHNKEKIILYETKLNLTKIFLYDNNIYFEENNENIYKLDNF